jgi:hypothetical protein
VAEVERAGAGPGQRPQAALWLGPQTWRRPGRQTRAFKGVTHAHRTENLTNRHARRERRRLTLASPPRPDAGQRGRCAGPPRKRRPCNPTQRLSEESFMLTEFAPPQGCQRSVHAPEVPPPATFRVRSAQSPCVESFLLQKIFF